MTDTCQCPSGSRCDGHEDLWAEKLLEQDWSEAWDSLPEPEDEGTVYRSDAVSPREEWVRAWDIKQATHR